MCVSFGIWRLGVYNLWKGKEFWRLQTKVQLKLINNSYRSNELLFDIHTV